ncbi:hypothetical protein RYX36_017997 [Vicia faba]
MTFGFSVMMKLGLLLCGPSQMTLSKDIVVIRATNWVDNYNVSLLPSDISVVCRIAKWVSGSNRRLA